MNPLILSPDHTLTNRSEEHTSELQSRQYLVCRLLLEKKKNQPPHSHPAVTLRHTHSTRVPQYPRRPRRSHCPSPGPRTRLTAHRRTAGDHTTQSAPWH